MARFLLAYKEGRFAHMDIRDLGHETYLIGRRVIQAGVPGMFDLEKQADRDELIRIADGLYKSKHDRACYGDLTVCVLWPYVEPIAGSHARYTEGQMHFGDLHEGAKEILRKEFPEYADDI